MFQVLYVDADREAGRRFSGFRCWTRPGFQRPQTVGSASEALKKLEQKKYDLLITEVKLYGMNGISLIHELKRRKIQVPVLVCSACTDFQYVREAMRLGVMDYLPKPLTDLSLSAELTFLRKAFQKKEEPSAVIGQEQTMQLYRYIINGESDSQEQLREILDSMYGSSAGDAGPVETAGRAEMLFAAVWSEMLAEWPGLSEAARYRPRIRPEQIREDVLRNLWELRQISQQFRLFLYRSDVSGVVHLMIENMGKPFSGSRMAEKLNRSEDYIRTCFRKAAGITLGQYENMLKMEWAARRLEQTDDRIYLIAAACGYRTTDYFSGLFRKYFGITPVEYRKIHGIKPKIRVD